MTTASSTRLMTVLKQTELFTDEQLAELLEQKRTTGHNLTETAVASGYVTETVFLEALARAMKMPFVQLDSAAIEKEALEKLTTKVAFQYHVIPITIDKGALLVATNDPFNAQLLDALRLASRMRVRIALSTSLDIAKASKKFYGVGADTVEKLIQDDRIDLDATESLMKADVSELDQEASIVKFVNQIIWEAFTERSTDIHLEPLEDELRIRYRVDGLLRQTPLPSHLHRFQAAIISRIKVMANMDIAEKRLPQDGRIGLRIQGEDLDIRVSTMPTVYGESVSLRLLMKGKSLIGMSELGMCDDDVDTIQKLIHKPNGIILVTGPTGSGKSTSLYAYLNEINFVDRRILTIEDPIEYEMAGVNQVQLREDIGLTFANALRTFLRQDPDIIMIGEIRDFETAEIAIRASLTGHLVFSTLHTNDAPGAVTRLLDMGVEPFLVASAVKAIVAQRLVRRICENCQQPVKADENLLRTAGFPMDRLAEAKILTGAGCEKCHGTGYRGRTGIYEILLVTEALEPLILAKESTSVIKQKALGMGMRTLRDDGWEKVIQGVTSVEEVLRASEENE